MGNRGCVQSSRGRERRRHTEVGGYMSLPYVLLIPSSSLGMKIQAMDFNRDGIEDLVVFADKTHLYVGFADGLGKFSFVNVIQ